MSAITSAFTEFTIMSLARWQHQFDVDLNFLSYPAPLSVLKFRPKCN